MNNENMWDVLTARLAETIAWCQHLAVLDVPARDLRSNELLPPSITEHEETYPTLWEERRQIVAALSHTRANILLSKGIDILAVDAALAGGSLLLYFPSAQLADGEAHFQTQGFFDEKDCPPWDTWIWYHVEVDKIENDSSYGESILCWIPPSYLDIASIGVEVSISCSLQWAADVENDLTDKLHLHNLLP